MTHYRRMIRTMAAFGAMMGTVVLGGCSGSNSAPQAPAGASTTTSTPIPNSGEKGEMNTQSKTTTNSAKSTPQTTGSPGKIVKTDAEWKKQLTPEQYRILREKGTEPAFTGKYWNTKTPGNYKCAACGEILFTSNEKFDSHCGWPSFYKALDKSKVEEHVDTSFGMKRTEVVCAKCGGHLGHVFDDAPDMPTGLRYCINSESIVLEKKDESANVENQPDKARK